MANSKLSDDDILRLFVIIVLAAAMGLGIMEDGAGASDAYSWAAHWGYECHVQQVTTGDQILCNDSTAVRLIGIAAPGPSYGLVGEQSAKALASVAGVGSVLRLELDQSGDDSYGRVLAYVYLPDGRLINALLADAGYAQARHQPPNLLHQEVIDAAEVIARSEARGLWQEPAFICFREGVRAEDCGRH